MHYINWQMGNHMLPFQLSSNVSNKIRANWSNMYLLWNYFLVRLGLVDGMDFMKVFSSFYWPFVARATRTATDVICCTRVEMWGNFLKNCFKKRFHEVCVYHLRTWYFKYSRKEKRERERKVIDHPRVGQQLCQRQDGAVRVCLARRVFSLTPPPPLPRLPKTHTWINRSRCLINNMSGHPLGHLKGGLFICCCG